MRNSQSNSPDVETGFPCANSGTTSNGSFSIHATRSLIKNLANYRKDHKDKNQRVWTPWQTVLILLVCSPSLLLYKKDWLHQVQPPGRFCLPLGEGEEAPVPRWDSAHGPALSLQTDAMGGYTDRWAAAQALGWPGATQRPQQAMELEMLQQVRAWGMQFLFSMNPFYFYSVSTKQWVECSLLYRVACSSFSSNKTQLWHLRTVLVFLHAVPWAAPPASSGPGHKVTTNTPHLVLKPVILVSAIAHTPRGERQGRAGRGHVISIGLLGIAVTVIFLKTQTHPRASRQGSCLTQGFYEQFFALLARAPILWIIQPPWGSQQKPITAAADCSQLTFNP